MIELALSLSDVSPQTLFCVFSGSVALAAIAYAVFKHYGMMREAAIASAFLSGARVAAVEIATKPDTAPAQLMEDAFLAAAKDYGVHSHVDERLGDGLLPNGPPPPDKPAAPSPNKVG